MLTIDHERFHNSFNPFENIPSYDIRMQYFFIFAVFTAACLRLHAPTKSLCQVASVLTTWVLRPKVDFITMGRSCIVWWATEFGKNASMEQEVANGTGTASDSYLCFRCHLDADTHGPIINVDPLREASFTCMRCNSTCQGVRYQGVSATVGQAIIYKE